MLIKAEKGFKALKKSSVYLGGSLKHISHYAESKIYRMIINANSLSLFLS